MFAILTHQMITLKASCLDTPKSARVFVVSSNTLLGNVVASLTESFSPILFYTFTKFTTSCTVVEAFKNLRISFEPSGHRICSVVIVLGSESDGGSGTTTIVAFSASLRD